MATMQPGPARGESSAQCMEAGGGPPGRSHGSAWSSASDEHGGARQRLAHLAHTLEVEVIPRLVGAHRGDVPAAPATAGTAEIEAFVELLRKGTDVEVAAIVSTMHRRGRSVEAIFLGLFAPAAHQLGQLWLSDRCDFSSVTVCLGRLQSLLREWSPAFGREIEHPPNGRRILLGQHPEEQHSFGLSMVAEFFRRDGWEVLGGVGGAVPDPSAQASRDWFDVVGFSVGSETRLKWLYSRICQVRENSRNRNVVVMVGGPLFVVRPELAAASGADAVCHDAGQAPLLAEQFLSAGHARR